jgi:nicotinate-nucleotide adenylyltransferase
MQLAESAIDALQLDFLCCVPAGQPPHRSAPIASSQHRLAMAKLAFEPCKKCSVDESEVLYSGPSWSIQTLERLRHQYPDASLVLILGADAFLGLPTWHRWKELLTYAHIAVANRPNSELILSTMAEPLRSLWSNCYVQDSALLKQQRSGYLVSFTITPCSVSATNVRSNLSQGFSISQMVPSAVEKYINYHHLYR